MEQSKVKYKKWNESDVQSAIKFILDGNSYGEASAMFGIPKATLHYKIKNIDSKRHHGHQPIFSLFVPSFQMSIMNR